ncbi:MAG: aminotransferase class I/II-fold pyridoxal phosphate-dependent enzyme [Candidatus Heimdallarchaeota archaeon]
MQILDSSSKKVQGHLAYRRNPIEFESPEEFGYERIRYNLAESSVPDFVLGRLGLDLDKLVLRYIDHMGNPRLRNLIAEDSISFDQVMITTGAAGALFIVATSLLRPDDHVVLLHPNYAANLETPRAIGCQIGYLKLSMENQFRLEVAELEQLIKPNTRLISLTYPQNPTGTLLTETELEEIVDLVESQSCYLLLDETYREMTPGKPLPVAASLSKNVISVSSFSKAYGLPGIRLGWLISQNEILMHNFLAAKELIYICNSIVDEEIAAHFLSRKEEFLSGIQSHVKKNFGILSNWMAKNRYMEWIKPAGGVIALPRVKPQINLDLEQFYETLKMKYHTFVAPGYWFELDKRFMRIGYGYPDSEQLAGGLNCITQAIEDSLLA